MIPQTYEAWRHCITHDCGITLTADWIQQRLLVLREVNHHENQRFIRLYGEAHWRRVITWFERSAQEFP